MRILIAGDFCPRDRVAALIEKEDYASVLGEVKDIVSQADYAIVNFECPVTNGGEKPITKVGPNLQCSEKGMEAVKWAGFDCVTLGNNHFYDFGEEGVQHTMEACNKYGMDSVGGGANLAEASKILYKQIGGQMLAIINCCEHEFSIATETTGGSNPLNPIQQYYAIKEAKAKADYVLVIVHGGHELFQLPSPRMVEAYHFFIDAGADAVVNHHQHCYSGYEVYGGKPIFYGLGNFCFDNPNKHEGIWIEGFLVSIEFSCKNSLFEIHPYRQCADAPNIKLLPLNSFEASILELNTIIVNPDELENMVNDYYTTIARFHSNIFEPFFNRYYLAAKGRGWMPSFISSRRKKSAKDYVVCEAHRDVLIHWLMQ